MVFATDFSIAPPAAAKAPLATRRAALPGILAFLQETAQTNQRNGAPHSSAAFDQASRSLAECLSLIEQHNVVSRNALLAGLEYLRRVARYVVPTHGNVAALYLIATMVAHKFQEDVPYDNRTFSHVLRVPVAEVNRMELEFLALITFDLSATEEDLEQIAEFVQSRTTTTTPAQSAAATTTHSAVASAIQAGVGMALAGV